MSLDTRFLKSRVARRFFMMFLGCTVLPMAVLAIVSYQQVSVQLRDQSHARLRQAAKTQGMGIFERFILLETELQQIAAGLSDLEERFARKTPIDYAPIAINRLKSLALFKRPVGYVPLAGQMETPPEPDLRNMAAMGEGKSVITQQKAFGKPSRIFMMRMIQHRPQPVVLIGEIPAEYLWGIGTANTLPPMTELCVLDEANEVLISSLPVSENRVIQRTVQAVRDSGRRQFESRLGNNVYLAAYWPLFLESRYAAPNLLIVLGESKAGVLLPMANFAKTFPLVVLMAFWVVLLMSITSIRKRLRPLERLKEATQRIAHKDFNSRVNIDSGDEFEDLAEAFNAMTGRLEKQFSALQTMSEIGQAVLSHLDRDQIIATVCSRMREVLPCQTVHVRIVDAGDKSKGSSLAGLPARGAAAPSTVRLSDVEIEALSRNPFCLWFDRREDFPPCLAPSATETVAVFLVLPVFIEERLSAFIALGFRNREDIEEEDLVQVRQLADQAAVALANAQLLEELAVLNWGTLQALARTVDAKSPWTAGHSEGVTNLALEIGRAMGLTPRELETLNRGALLHDIGKIGVPAAILDKPGPLNDTERRTVQQHPSIGARIVEPLEAFRDAIPFILEHHERFDGQGYPNGRKGKGISLGARILAVADVFESLTADRPYRAGWPRDRALEFIADGSGGHFDPAVVKVFLKIMGSRNLKPANDPDGVVPIWGEETLQNADIDVRRNEI